MEIFALWAEVEYVQERILVHRVDRVQVWDLPYRQLVCDDIVYAVEALIIVIEMDAHALVQIIVLRFGLDHQNFKTKINYEICMQERFTRSHPPNNL